MTDRATDGGLEMGPSADELFGGAETESLEGVPVDRRPGDGPATVTIEDRTAADVFEELRTEAGAGVDATDLLADESPEDIIASADEPAEPEPDLDDDLTVDDETLGDLLLTDRTEGEEFLWVDAGDADDAFSSAAVDDPDPEPDDPFDETADPSPESATEGPVPLVDPESATESDGSAARAEPASSDDEASFRGGLVTDAPDRTVDSSDERPDEDDDAEAADSSDDPDGDAPARDDPDGDERSEPTRAADRSADAFDDGSSGPLALLAKLPIVGRLF